MEIKSADKLTNLTWLNLFDVDYVDQNGRHRSWQIASRSKAPKCISGKFNRPDAVVIVPFHTAENKVVIIKEYRVPLADYEYGFPAGLIDPGETIEQTARRELQEETGLIVTRFRKISPPVYSSAGMTDESVAMVYVECTGQPSTAGNTSSELIEVQLVSRSRASRMCENPALKFDVKAWLVLVRFAEKGNIE
ncbi:ADP-ribose pyrophosphatase (EC [Olavius sp. associated proteobacterium Delta 1]|nr:ADP-ribose pyrophosphatase (EC [Olavius sp. associated proteobacterium Delta 1]